MPDSTRSPRLFVKGGGPTDTTVLNWHDRPEREFYLYAQAFLRAAQKAAENERLDMGGRGDFDACPVVYLYRHALELLLKAILVGPGKNFIDSPPELEQVVRTGHSLTKLLPYVREIFKERQWDKLGDTVTTFDDLESIVLELDQVDAGSFAFRYPIDKKLNASTANHFTFSVREFARIMDEVLDTLDTACFALPAEWEAHSELIRLSEESRF